MADLIKHLEEMDGTLFAPIAGGVKDGSITTNMIKDGTISLDKLADGSITSAKITDGAVTTAKLADGGIGSRAIADTNVGASAFATGAITSAKVTDGQITTGAISDGTMTRDKLGSMVTNENLKITTPAGNITVTAKLISLGNKLYMLTYCGKPNLNVGGSTRGYKQVSLQWGTAFTTVYSMLLKYAQDGDVDSYAGYTVPSTTGADTYIYSGGGSSKIILSLIVIGKRAS